MNEPPLQKRRRTLLDEDNANREWSLALPAAGTSKPHQQQQRAPNPTLTSSTQTPTAAATTAPGMSSCVYTLKVTYGEVVAKLPSWLTTCKKQELVDMLVRKGLDSRGTKPVLLERLRVSVPWVTFKIDARESFPRALVVALDQFQYDATHLYEVEMPRRGPLTYGTKRLKDIEDYFELYLVARRVGSVYGRRNANGTAARDHAREESSGAGAVRGTSVAGGRRGDDDFRGANGSAAVGSDGGRKRNVSSTFRPQRDGNDVGGAGGVRRGGGDDVDGEADDASCVSSTPCRCGACETCHARGDMSALSSMCIRRGLKVHEVLQWDWESLGDTRSMCGAAFDQHCETPKPSQVVRLEQLCLQVGDEMRVLYDFGDQNRLVMRVESIETVPYVLPEVCVMNRFNTRHEILSRGGPRVPPQYRGAPAALEKSDDSNSPTTLQRLRSLVEE